MNDETYEKMHDEMNDDENDEMNDEMLYSSSSFILILQAQNF